MELSLHYGFNREDEVSIEICALSLHSIMSKIPHGLRGKALPPVSFFEDDAEFHLRRKSRRWILFRNGQRLAGADQEGLEILYHLLLKADREDELPRRLVEYKELFAVWDDFSADQKNRLQQQIVRLRRVLDTDRSGRPSLIETISTRGYLFTGSRIQFTVGAASPSLKGKAAEETVRTSPSLREVRDIFLKDGLLGVAIYDVSTRENGVLHPKLDRIGDSTKKFAFVNNEELNAICGHINANAFGRPHEDGMALWRGNYATKSLNIQDKIDRNRTHYEKNPYCLMLIRSFEFLGFAPKEPFIGFTHVLPLSKGGNKAYCRGDVKDNNLRGGLIAGTGEGAESLLAFSIAIDTYGSLRKAYEGMPSSNRREGAWKAKISSLLCEALAYHMQVLLQIHQQERLNLPILAQNDGSADVINFLKLVGFTKTDLRTKDRCPIWIGHA